MIRITGRSDKFVPVTKFNDTRYRIAFDKVDIDEDTATYTLLDYFTKPTTEQVQEDVIKYTTQRYIDEGKEPPKDIDVSKYVID